MSTINRPRARSPLRFTLSGLLMLVLSISMGLALWRLPGGTSVQFLYGCFVPWFVLGMAQRANLAWDAARQSSSRDSATRMGQRVAVAVPIAIAMLLMCAFLLEAATHVDWFNLNADLGDYEQLGSWILHRLTWTLFFFAIVCGYWSGDPLAGTPPARRGTWATLLPVGFIATALLVVLLIVNTAAILAMAYEGMEGVANFQPIRWAGHSFDPWAAKPVAVQRGFIVGGLVSMALLFGALTSIIVLSRRWNSGFGSGAVLISLAASLLIVTVGLTLWCGTTALPVMSPLLAETM